MLTTKVDSRFDYAFKGSISDSRDVDFYKITAPQNTSGAETVMSVMVWGTENGDSCAEQDRESRHASTLQV